MHAYGTNPPDCYYVMVHTGTCLGKQKFLGLSRAPPHEGTRD